MTIPGPALVTGSAGFIGFHLSRLLLEEGWRVTGLGFPPREAVEAATGRRAARRLMEMQPGDAPATWADAGPLERLTGCRPRTGSGEGDRAFVDWYRGHYGIRGRRRMQEGPR